ncbi:MAG: efflux RND transporter periplasmic adaptor subunit [Sorangiineae bacterium PRO1]|nr:efflux RND transporter periplasmic adaptor subunit [Sorangiineae bacterium PRO1]
MRRSASLVTSARFRTAIVIAALAACGCNRASATKPEPPAGSASARPATGAPPLFARGHVVSQRTVSVTVPTVGTLAANEYVRVVSEISRRLVKVHVEEGAVVKKGAVLFTLDSSDLGADVRRLEVKKKLLASQEARSKQLLSQNLVSQAEYDRVKSELDEITAEIGTRGVTLQKTRIRAPFAGRVGLRRVSVGAWVTPETLLTTLSDTSRLKVDFALPERYAPDLRVGHEFFFRVAGRAERFKGQVIAIEPEIDRATRSVSVRGLTENPGDVLASGGFANVEVPIGADKPVLTVPAQALVPSVKGHGVWVLADGKASLRPVEIGQRSADDVEVVSGLSAGETVLVNNLLRLREGAPVTLEK